MTAVEHDIELVDAVVETEVVAGVKVDVQGYSQVPPMPHEYGHLIAQRVSDGMPSGDSVLDLPAAARELQRPGGSDLIARVSATAGTVAAGLCLVPNVNYGAAALAVLALGTGLIAVRRSNENLDRGLGVAVTGVVMALLALFGSAASIAAYAGGGDDAPAIDRTSRAMGLATGEVLADDLGVALGFLGQAGLPVTLTNTADVSLSYNVTIEAVTGLGQRITADVVLVSSMAPGQSTTATIFDNLDEGTRLQLKKATFRIIEASSY